MAHGQGELGPGEAWEKRRWYWDGFPAQFNWIEIQPLVDVLADGWKAFPLPSVQRIELF